MARFKRNAISFKNVGVKLIYVLCFLALSNCAPKENSTIENSSFDAKDFSGVVAQTLIPQNDVDCFLGETLVRHDSSITAYQNSSVPYGGSCVSEVRKCYLNELSGSYNFTSCSVGAPASCLFNGATIQHGESTTAYTSSSVGVGQSCLNVAETRVCNNGVLSGSAVYGSCEVSVPRSCLFNGLTVNHGSVVTAYESSSSQFGNSCKQEERLCHDGTLAGSFEFASCTIDQPASCLFDGRTIAHGESVIAFESSSSQYNSQCVSETRLCQNGVLSGKNNFSSCTVNQPLNCSFNNETVLHGSSIVAFQANQVAYGNQCVSEVRSCVNGVLSGTLNEKNCVVEAPKNCLINNTAVVHGSSVTTYSSSTVPYGQSCQSQVRACSNGHLSGSYSYETCVVDKKPDIIIDPVVPLNCQFNGATVIDQTRVTAYESATVPFGSKCKSESRICDDGFLTGSFAHSKCDVEQPKACSLNGKSIAHGNSVTVFLSATVPSGQTCQSEVRSCNNGILSGTAVNESCVIDKPPVPPQPPEVCSNSNIIWEFPADCKAYCGNGVGYNRSRISRDNGKTWLNMRNNKLPDELNQIWNYLIKKNGKDSCHRPKLNYIASKNKGYVVLPVAKIPDCKVCRYIEVQEPVPQYGSCRPKNKNETRKVSKFICEDVKK
jgi:hypothetical protein